MVVRIEVDGAIVGIEAGSNLLDGLRAAGFAIDGQCAVSRAGYAPLSSCRRCLVEIDEDKTLVPACRTIVEQGMVVHTMSERLVRVRKTLRALVDVETRSIGAGSVTYVSSSSGNVDKSKSSRVTSTASIVFDPAACIRCGLCRSACQDVQSNGVIGIAGRGKATRIIFDLDVALSESSCTSCGECVQVCPTGALGITGFESSKCRPLGETVCPYCSVGCHVALSEDESGRLLATGANGPANKGRLCVKGRFGFEPLVHPDRLRVPLVRKTAAAKTAAIDLRDRASADWVHELFRPASWEEALDLAAEGLGQVCTRHGGAATGVLGSAKASNEDAYILQKLARALLKTNNVDHCTRLCASVPPLAEAIGFAAVTVPVEAAREAEVILMVGSNPEVNHPVAATFLKNAIAGGTKLILIDPYRQPFARHALHHLQLRPGTDVTLLSAMMQVIVSEQLYDTDFIRNRVDGFDEVATAVAALTPEIAERVTGVAASQIRASARLFAGARTAIAFWGMGASQHVHGADNIRCVVSLALMCGHVGKPGSGLHPLRGQNNVQGSCDAGLTPSTLTGYQQISDDVVRARFERAWGCDLPATPGLTVCEILEGAWRREIKALYVAGGNPAMANPDLARTREALSRLDFLVVQDIFPTETAVFADVILPAMAIAERGGSYTSTDRIVQRTTGAVAAPGDAMPDWWITREIGRRLGADWAGVELDTLFDEMALQVPMLRGFTAAGMKSQVSVHAPHSEPASLFADGFPTPNGRAKLRAVSVQLPGELPDAEFPFVLVTGRVREHWHTGSMTRRSPTLDALAPRAELSVAACDFDRMGLRADTQVLVETRRGRVRVACNRDERQQVGVIFLPFAFYEAAANELTAINLDPTTRVPEYKFCAARVVPLNMAAQT